MENFLGSTKGNNANISLCAVIESTTGYSCPNCGAMCSDRMITKEQILDIARDELTPIGWHEEHAKYIDGLDAFAERLVKLCNISNSNMKSHPCKKIRAGKYEYRGWIISSVGYYHPEHCVCWEGYDPKTGHADFHGFSKKEIKWLIDDNLFKNGR